MDARPILVRIAQVLNEEGLEAVLIGNAAAALQGAPVTTIDFDFMFRKTPANLRKLKSMTKKLGAVLFKPHFPVSGLHRISRNEDQLQLDFMATVDGIKSFEGLCSRATRIDFEGCILLVADLADVIASKRAAGRPRDIAALEVLDHALAEKKSLKKSETKGP